MAENTSSQKSREPRKPITFTRLDQLKAEPLTPIIAGLLYPGVHAIVGKSGSCKTFVGGSMGLSIATGTPFMGRAVEDPGAVFYIGGEGSAGLRKRLQGWANFHGVDLDGVPLFVSDAMLPLHDPLNSAAVIEEIRRTVEDLQEAAGMEPRAVFIDTFARGMAGADENSASDVGRFVQGLDWIASTWPCAVVVIHHVGHGEGSKERGRGSSAFYAALDGELLVQSDGGPVTIRCTKAKDWPADQGMTLARHIVEVETCGIVETTLVLAPLEGTTAKDREKELRREIKRLRDSGQPIRAIAADLGVTKSKVEHVLATISRESARYEEASGGR